MSFIIFISIVLTVLFVLSAFSYRSIKNLNGRQSKDFSYLKWVIVILSLAIFLGGIALIGGLIYHGIGLLGLVKDGYVFWDYQFGNMSSKFTLDVTNTPFGLLVDTVHGGAILGLFICLRAFMKNILTETIFVNQNVRLARWVTYCLLIGSLIYKAESGFIVVSGENYSYAFLHTDYLLAAVLVWTLSIILEKAIAIAEENEFTI